MAYAIGTLTTMTAWRGSICDTGATEGAIFKRPGIAGAGVVVGAAVPQKKTVETDYLGTKSNALTHIASAVAIVGTVVSVTDDAGTTKAHSYVESVEVTFSQAVLGAAAWLVKLQWSIWPEA